MSHIVLSELACRVKVVPLGAMKARGEGVNGQLLVPASGKEPLVPMERETGCARSQFDTLDNQQKSLAPARNQTTVSQSSNLHIVVCQCHYEQCI